MYHDICTVHKGYSGADTSLHTDLAPVEYHLYSFSLKSLYIYVQKL